MKDWRKSPEPPGMMGMGYGEAGSPDAGIGYAETNRTSASGSNAQSSRTSPSVASDLNEQLSTDNVVSKDAAATFPSSKRLARTKLTLVDMARRVVAQRIHLYDSFGDAPFRLVRPLLEQCTPRKLWLLEESSPHLIEETDYIWRRNCLRDFKDLKESIKGGTDAEQHAYASAAVLGATHGWREVYRDKMVQDHEAKQAATEHVKQKYALLRASKEATQVRIVTETPVTRRKGMVVGRHSLNNLTQGQRMMSKARRSAHTHAQAVRAQRSGALTGVRGRDEGPASKVVAVSAGPSTAASNEQKVPRTVVAGLRRAKTPPGFERIATRDIGEEDDFKRAPKRAKSSEGGSGSSCTRGIRQPATPTLPNSPPPTAQRSPLKNGVRVTKRKVAPTVVLSSDEEA